MPSTTSARQPSSPASVAASATSLVEERASASCRVETTSRLARARTDRVDPEVRPGSELSCPRASAANARAAPSGSEGASSTTGATSSSTPSSTVARSATSTPDGPTCTSSDVTPFSRSVRAASCAAFGVGIREQRADVPAVAAGRWADGVGQVRHERGRAERGDPDAVQRAARELRPDRVVGVVVGETAGLAQHRCGRLFPLRDVVLLPLGQGEMGVWAHVRRIGTAVGRDQRL